MLSASSRLATRRMAIDLLRNRPQSHLSAPTFLRCSGHNAHGASSRRTLFTSPARQSRSWKSSFARWGLAAGGIYAYFNWNSLTQGEDDAVYYSTSYLPTTETESETLPTLDTLAAARRQRLAVAAGPTSSTATLSSASVEAIPSGSSEASSASGVDSAAAAALEEEAEGEGAFNPETGEINWDCPCLGGMAYGPCGEDFREAFSCFVYSTVEPKGMDCIENFKKMQDCFRQHPDVYGAELTDDGDYDDLEDDSQAVHKEHLDVDVAGAPAPGEEVRSSSIAAAEAKPSANKPSKPATEKIQSTPKKSADKASTPAATSKASAKTTAKSKNGEDSKRGAKSSDDALATKAPESNGGAHEPWQDATDANAKVVANSK